MAPGALLYPLVVLATAASIIASQALISGAFSLTRQATMLGLLPRMSVLHTSADERGQIYVPAMNWMLMLAAIGLVIGFETSSRPRLRLRHRRDAHHGDHDAARCDLRAHRLGLVELARRRRDAALPRARTCVSRREPGESPPGRLVPARTRRAPVRHHDDLAARPSRFSPSASASRCCRSPTSSSSSASSYPHAYPAPPCS